MIAPEIQKRMQFGYIPADSWFCSNENIQFIQKRKQLLIFEMQDKRLTHGVKKRKGRVSLSG
jgi:hypothetical protein